MTDNKFFKEQFENKGQYGKNESAKQFNMYDLIEVAETYHKYKLTKELATYDKKQRERLLCAICGDGDIRYKTNIGNFCLLHRPF